MLKTLIKCGLVLVLGLVSVPYGLDLLYQSKPTPTVVYSNSSNTLFIKGFIANDNPVFKMFSAEITDMQALSVQLLGMIKAGKQRIFISINSPGGVLHLGEIFVSLMKDAQSIGVKFTCIVNGEVMSMATIIFTECDERFATVGSVIMWHSIAQSVNKRLNVFSAQDLADKFNSLNKIYWHNTRLHFYPWYFNKHFKQESVLTVTEVQANSFMYLKVIREHIVQ